MEPLGHWSCAAAGDPLALVPAVRAAVRAADPDVPLQDVADARRHGVEAAAPAALQRARRLGVRRWWRSASRCRASSACSAFVVERQRREIGVRLSLGAQAPDVVRLVAGRGLRLGARRPRAGAAARLRARARLERAPLRRHGRGRRRPTRSRASRSLLAAAGRLPGPGAARRTARSGRDPAGALRSACSTRFARTSPTPCGGSCSRPASRSWRCSRSRSGSARRARSSAS